MDNRESDELTGALSGALAALASSWLESDSRTVRTANGARDDARAANKTIQSLKDSGWFQRVARPIVSDALGGLLLAERAPEVPSVTPSIRQVHRINLARLVKSYVERLRWPPREGQYDEFGRSLKAGDMVTLFLGMTYEEHQSWSLGLLQSDPPDEDQRKQIYYAANALSNVLYGTELEFADFVAAWKRLFLGTNAAKDAHDDETKPPQIALVNPNITNVVPLGSEGMLPAFVNPSQNTDRANKWRVSVGPAGLPAGQVFFQVNYATAWTRNGKPYSPVVAAQGVGLSATNLQPTSFQAQSVFAVAANTIVDIAFGVVGA